MNKGSATKEGYLYHEPAFPVEGVRYQRGNNSQRLGILLRSQNWWNKNVLDLGCNVGFFSLRLALQGARVTGVDTDGMAISFAEGQARERSIENVTFQVPTEKENRFMNDKDVLLAFSVLPWIYETEENPEEYVRKLFQIPVAYVEIQYPPDGRASVPGVVDDASAREYLKQYYPVIIRLDESKDSTEGVVRNRTIWKCLKTAINTTNENKAYGSQAFVEMLEHVVMKKPRVGKSYSAKKEYEFLQLVEQSNIAPKPMLFANEEFLMMTRVQGVPITACRMQIPYLQSQFMKILSALKSAGISHNDIRPSNLIVGNDFNIYLIDFGWATFDGEEKPHGVNPVFGTDDEKAFEKIVEMYKKITA